MIYKNNFEIEKQVEEIFLQKPEYLLEWLKQIYSFDFNRLEWIKKHMPIKLEPKEILVYILKLIKKYLKNAIVLSIHKMYMMAIALGEKTDELRRKGNIEHKLVFPYITSPHFALWGILIVKVIKLPIPELWKKVEDTCSINKDQFDNYFKGKKIGYDYQILAKINFHEMLQVKECSDWTYPQNWRYAKKTDLNFMFPIEKKTFMKDGSLYRVNPLDENSIVEIKEKEEWKSTTIEWKNFDWGEEFSIGLSSGRVTSMRNYWDGFRRERST